MQRSITLARVKKSPDYYDLELSIHRREKKETDVWLRYSRVAKESVEERKGVLGGTSASLNVALQIDHVGHKGSQWE